MRAKGARAPIKTCLDEERGETVRMPHQKKTPRAALAAALALLASVGVQSGCAGQAQDELPGTHLDQAGQVAASHERCGACHRNGTRGNGEYETDDRMPMEALPLSEFEVTADPDDPNPPESMYIEAPEAGDRNEEL